MHSKCIGVLLVGSNPARDDVYLFVLAGNTLIRGSVVGPLLLWLASSWCGAGGGLPGARARSYGRAMCLFGCPIFFGFSLLLCAEHGRRRLLIPAAAIFGMFVLQ